MYILKLQFETDYLYLYGHSKIARKVKQALKSLFSEEKHTIRLKMHVYIEVTIQKGLFLLYGHSKIAGKVIQSIDSLGKLS